MTNTLLPLPIRPDRPVDPTALLVIHEIHRAFKELGFTIFLVGATARIILLENVYGLNAGRATTDVDFAFALDNWDQFTSIKKYLVSNFNCEEVVKVDQRLLMTLPAIGKKYKVDLIPFGGIEIKENTIAWPPDLAFMMNVAGYKDALASSVQVEVSQGTIINVASLPGIAILKIFAWYDRRYKDPKDAIDLFSLLRGYHEAGNMERTYEDAIEVLPNVDYDIELAGAWLLGKDASAIASKKTSAEIQGLLQGNTRRNLEEDMSRAMKGRDDALEYSANLLRQFMAGFQAQ